MFLLQVKGFPILLEAKGWSERDMAGLHLCIPRANSLLFTSA